MRTLILAAAMVLAVPSMRAQQAESNETTPPTTPQETINNADSQHALPEAIRPGHPLDPADVDVLTGKRDRAIQSSQKTPASVVLGNYGGYGTYSGFDEFNGRYRGVLDFTWLPLTRIGNPFLFLSGPPRGFALRGFRGGR